MPEYNFGIIEWIIIILAAIPPLALGLFMSLKSPLSGDGRTRCPYCNERIRIASTVCPYCRRRVKMYAAKTYKTRGGQFLLGFFLGILLDLFLGAAILKLLLTLGLL